MAKISRRFETPTGRRVELVPAEVNSFGPITDEAKRMTHFVFGVYVAEDGRMVQVALTRDELASVNRHADDYAKKYPWVAK